MITVVPPRDGPVHSRAGTASASTTVRVRGLNKRYPVRRSVGAVLRHPFGGTSSAVLQDVAFDVRDREVFGILGLNGAGKTTLLKIIAGLIASDGGHVDVAGVDVRESSPSARGVLAMVTADERSLYWRLSAVENLRLFAALYRVERQRVAASIADALASVGLRDTGHQMVGTFSSGMRQRLLVARALLARPRVMLLDEPTRSLDPLSADAFRTMLRETLAGQMGATVILATHNTEEAFVYCDRVAVLQRGRIAALGSAEALAERFALERYTAWTPTPHHPAFRRLAMRGVIDLAAGEETAIRDGAVSFVIPAGSGVAASVLRELVEAGVAVTRFERSPMLLSSLIARIAEAHEHTTGGAKAHA